MASVTIGRWIEFRGRVMLYSAVILGILLTAVCSAECKEFQGIVKHVIDGDSLIVMVEGQRIEVRLYGIDCPEFDQPYSHAAKRFVKKRIKGRRVTVVPVDRDKYGRLVAMIVHDGTVVNGLLVEAGLAWVYPRYCRKKICRNWSNKEQRARRQKLHLWQDKKPVSPWRWKQLGYRKKAH